MLNPSYLLAIFDFHSDFPLRFGREIRLNKLENHKNNSEGEEDWKEEKKERERGCVCGRERESRESEKKFRL